MSEALFDRTRARLGAAGITGRHRSHDRANTLKKIDELRDGKPDATFGISGVEQWAPRDVLAALAQLTGCSPELEDCEGWDTIDPDVTVRALVFAGERLRDAAARGDVLLAVTGHPTGMLETYVNIVAAYRRAGGKVLRAREDEELDIGTHRHAEIRYVGAVGCLADWGSLKHTHSPVAMEALLAAQPWPDLVLADHGFAGAAVERDIATIAVMDINDPALAVAATTRSNVLVIPMDDNRSPASYEPAWSLITAIIEKRASDQDFE